MNPEKVLVVDDETDMLEILSEHLVMEGFEVRTATNGFEALEVIREFQPHFVLTDVRMPKCGGVDLFRQICKMQSPPNVMFMTGYAGLPEIDELKSRANFAGFLGKPIMMEDVISKIKELQKARTR